MTRRRRPSLSRIAATAAALLIVVGCSDDDRSLNLSAGDPRGNDVDERLTWLLSRDELDALSATDRDRLVTSLEGTGSDAASIFSDVSEDGPGGIVARSLQEITETIATAQLDDLLSAWNASQHQ